MHRDGTMQFDKSNKIMLHTLKYVTIFYLLGKISSIHLESNCLLIGSFLDDIFTGHFYGMLFS